MLIEVNDGALASVQAIQYVPSNHESCDISDTLEDQQDRRDHEVSCTGDHGPT